MGMKTLPTDIHERVVFALNKLQDMDKLSINSLALNIGVKKTWLHLLKNEAVGRQTFNNITKVYNYLAFNMPDLMESYSSVAVDSENTSEKKLS
jgi:hypothetical protein